MIITVLEYQTLTGDTSHTSAQILAAITAADNMVTNITGRKFEEDNYVYDAYNDMPKDRVHVPAFPISSTVPVVVTGATIRHIDYAAGIIRFTKAVKGAVHVEYRGGYDEIPDIVKEACALIAQQIMTAIDDGGREVTSERLGDYQTSYASSDSRIAPAAMAMLAPFKTR